MIKKSKKQLISSGFIILILVMLDQITKRMAVLFLKNASDIPVISDVFELHYLENTSAAFGMDPILLLHKIFQFHIFNENPELYLNVRMSFFYILTIGIILGLFYIFCKIPKKKRYRYLDIVLILFIAGAFGNLIDRILYKYVIDFFYFKLIDFPVFNVADVYVTCAAFAMLGFGIFYYKDEDFEQIKDFIHENRNI